MVKNRGRETSFRTMGKSGRKKVSFQDTEHEVSKATSTSFKTIDKNGTKQVNFMTLDKSGTKRVSFKTIEETSNISIPFKTFDDWVKARTANCDKALKDALSFVSGKKSAVDREKDSPQARPAQLGEIQPQHIQSQAAGRQTTPVIPSSPGRPPWTEERSPWSAEEESLP